MARYEDFFPAPIGGGGTERIETNEGTVAGQGVFRVTTSTIASRTVTFTGTTSGLGDLITVAHQGSFTIDGIAYAGTVIQPFVSGDALAGRVTIRLATEQSFDAGQDTNIVFTTESSTVIQSDIQVGGDQFVAGDSTVTGDFTHDGDAFSTSAETIVLGDGDDGTVTVNGNLVLDDIAPGTIRPAGVIGLNGDDTVVTDLIDGTHIADDAITAVKINPDVAGLGIVQGNSGSLDINTGDGLHIQSDILSARIGNGLIFESGVIQLGALALNNTFAATSNTLTDDPAVLAAYVAAFGAGASGDISVGAGTTIRSGDLFLLTRTTGADPGTESYIYVGDETTSPATISADDFVDITHSGDVVELVTVGDGISSSGSRTNPVLSLDIAAGSNLEFDSGELSVTDNVAIPGSLNVDGATTLDSTTIDASGTNEFIVSGLAVPAGATLGTGTVLGINASNEIEIITVAGAGGTEDTVSKFGDSDDLVDSTITDDGTTVTIGGTNFSHTGNGRFDVNAEIVTLGDGLTGATTLNGDNIDINGSTGGINLNSSAGTIQIGSRTGTNNTGRVNIHSGSTNQVDFNDVDDLSDASAMDILATDGALRIWGSQTILLANSQLRFETSGVGTVRGETGELTWTTQHGFNFLNTGVPGNSSITNAVGNLGIQGEEITLVSDSIATNATDATPLNLVVGSNGHVMTQAARTTDTREIRIGNDSNISNVAANNIVILDRITGDRTFNLPANPNTGDFIDVVNLSGSRGGGSGTFRWSMTSANLVMGVAAPFELDDPTASFRLLYSNATYGWLIVGAN